MRHSGLFHHRPIVLSGMTTTRQISFLCASIFWLSGCVSASGGPWAGPVAGAGRSASVSSAASATSRAAANQSTAHGIDNESAAIAVETSDATARAVAEQDELERIYSDASGLSGALDAEEELSVEPQWDLDVQSYEGHERVAFYVNRFSTTARESFARQLSRGTRYEAMIRTRMRESGLPEDLTYLALIESGYDPDAYSRAAAVGMWQFMSSTARNVGLRVDWWMDERRDPARATDAAIRYLNELQQQFGSYYLAAAAYNGGPGRVARGLTQYATQLEGFDGDDRFFALADKNYLAAETRNYVPQLIAAALVAKTPDRYDMALDSLPRYEYDSLSVAPATSLAVVTVASGADADEIRTLNPALIRGITPPDAEVWVRVPIGTADLARAALDTMENLSGTQSVKVSGVVTEAAFAKKYGLTSKQLRWFNPGLKVAAKRRLSAGQTVRIPDKETLAFARDVPDPSIERYGTAAVSTSAGSTVHVVRRGETLSGIAKRYGTSVANLRSLNGIRGSRINAGQKLVVRRAASASRSGAKAASAKGSGSI